jgi:hypothetical protein
MGHLMSRRAKELPPKGSDAYWLAILPKPPLRDADPDTAEIWMRNVLKAGGVDGLEWAFKPENWPLPRLRSGLFHVYIRLRQEADEEAKTAARAAAAAVQARIRSDARSRRRAAGWA